MIARIWFAARWAAVVAAAVLGTDVGVSLGVDGLRFLRGWDAPAGCAAGHACAGAATHHGASTGMGLFALTAGAAAFLASAFALKATWKRFGGAAR